MITFLSGGTGTPKLLLGVRTLIPDEEIAVVVNTAEDLWISGNHLSPDVDTVIYLFSGILNTETWWGMRDDTFVTHSEAERLGTDEFIAIGDRDRAVHIARADFLRGGMTLTEATSCLCRAFGVRARVLPMCDSGVTTIVKTPDGWKHFQEYWVRLRGRVEIDGVARRADSPPVLTKEAHDAIRESDAVVIGPSNPVTSILPILECEGARESLRGLPVIAVSPFIGDRPVSGPASALMKAAGYEPGSYGTFLLYKDLIDLFVQDIRDPSVVTGAIRLDTLMTDVEKSVSLAREILTRIPGLETSFKAE
jgi:LPPG:FO 2-phospho-L-lactate transferase